MANENKVIIEVEVDSKDAQAAIELFGKESVKVMKDAEKANKGFADSFKTFGAPIAVATSAFEAGFAAINKVIATFSRAIDEAVEDQKQFIQIQGALQGTGDSSKEAAQSIVDFADALEDATGVGDELAKQLFISAKAFGISTDEAKKLTKASIDYAAATGVDVQTANQQLGMTLDGTVGRIGALGEEFRNLTEDQLKNGAAIDLIIKRYDGAAAAQMDTFGGATSNLSNAFGDLLKAIGKIITESTIIIASLEGIASAVSSVAKVISAVAKGPVADYNEQLKLEAATKFVAQSELVGNSSKEVKEQFRDLFNQTEITTSSLRQFTTFGEKLANTEIGAKNVGLTGKALEEFNKKAAKAAEELKKAREEAEKFSSGILQTYGTDAEKLAQKTQDTLLEIARREKLSFKEGGIVAEDAYKLRLRVVEGFNQDVQKSNDQANEKELAEAKKLNEELNNLYDLRAARIQRDRDNIAKTAADPVGALAKGVNTENGELAAVGVGLTTSILKGAEGATKVVSQSIGAIADVFLPGIGGAVGGLAEQLSKGPEATKVMVRQFVEAIPDIIIAIAESIPVVVEVLVDTLVNKGGAIRIGIAIAKAMSGQAIFAAIGKQMGIEVGEEAAKPYQEGAKQFVEDVGNAREGFVEQFKLFINNAGPTIGAGILAIVPAIQEGLSQSFSSFAKSELPNAFKQFISDIGTFFSGLFEGIERLADLPKQIFEALGGLFEPLTTGIKNLLQPINDLIGALGGKGGRGLIAEAGGSGGGSGIIAETFDRAFSKGGIVYAADGFVSRGTDTVPAMLTPGEAVVPKDTTVQLAKFLSKQNSPTNNNDALLMQILQIVSAPMVVSAEAKVNQSAFADIILQLNRQNARLSA